MIQASDTMFPNNVVELVALRSELLDDDLSVFKRPLRNTDPNQSIGVYAADWRPNDDSKEMRGLNGIVEPTLSTYRVIVQGFIKDTDRVRGLNVHTVMSRMIRSMLYSDEPLRVQLAMLSATLSGTTEKSQRWGISSQRYFANELSGDWLYLSILEFWLETETR